MLKKEEVSHAVCVDCGGTKNPNNPVCENCKRPTQTLRVPQHA